MYRNADCHFCSLTNPHIWLGYANDSEYLDTIYNENVWEPAGFNFAQANSDLIDWRQAYVQSAVICVYVNAQTIAWG